MVMDPFYTLSLVNSILYFMVFNQNHIHFLSGNIEHLIQLIRDFSSIVIWTQIQIDFDWNVICVNINEVKLYL